MREMSYILKLTEGYTITNGAGHNYHGCENEPDTNIRMTVKWSEGAKRNVTDLFRIDCAEALSPKFERLLPQILQGETTSWRLSRVHVYSSGIFLDFVNDTLQDQKESLYAKDKYDEAEAIPSTATMEMMLSIDEKWKTDNMTMRFEVPLPDGSGVSTTLVRTNGYDPIEVTELNANGYRSLEFLKPVEDENNQHEIYSDLVEVTECSW